MNTTNISTADLVLRIHEAGFMPRSYSGRCMFGERCVGVDLDDASYLVELAGVPRPRLDSMGRGIIAYWPQASLTAEEAKQLDFLSRSGDEDDDEDAA